jgi:hypothetical protein
MRVAVFAPIYFVAIGIGLLCMFIALPFVLVASWAEEKLGWD